MEIPSPTLCTAWVGPRKSWSVRPVLDAQAFQVVAVAHVERCQRQVRRDGRRRDQQIDHVAARTRRLQSCAQPDVSARRLFIKGDNGHFPCQVVAVSPPEFFALPPLQAAQQFRLADRRRAELGATLRHPVRLHPAQRPVSVRLAQDRGAQWGDKARLGSGQWVAPGRGHRRGQFEIGLFWCQRAVLTQVTFPFRPQALTGGGYFLTQLGELGFGFGKTDGFHNSNIPKGRQMTPARC